MKLLDSNELPLGMSYPASFRRFVDRNLTKLEPWWIFDETLARQRMKGLSERFSAASLVPFAKREDNDDVACFDADSPGKVVIIHDFSSDGWERRKVLSDFYAWVRLAVEDMIEFDSLE